jgi:hypothetical protein
MQVANLSLFFLLLAVPGCARLPVRLKSGIAFASHSINLTFSPVDRWFAVSSHPTRKNKPVEVSVGLWLDAALPEVVVSPPHARAAKPMEGVSSVSRLSAGAPQVGRVITLPGTEAYWTVRLLLTGRANVFANLDFGRTVHSQLLALAS